MAERWARAGHPVGSYNRTRGKAERWVAEFGRRLGYSPVEAAGNIKRAKACGGRGDDVRVIMMKIDGTFATLGKHPILVDRTSTSARHARNRAFFLGLSLAWPIEALAKALISPERQGWITKPLWTSYPSGQPIPGEWTTDGRACWPDTASMRLLWSGCEKNWNLFRRGTVQWGAAPSGAPARRVLC